MSGFVVGDLIRVGDRLARVIELKDGKACLHYGTGAVLLKWMPLDRLSRCYVVDERDPWGPNNRRRAA